MLKLIDWCPFYIFLGISFANAYEMNAIWIYRYWTEECGTESLIIVLEKKSFTESGGSSSSSGDSVSGSLEDNEEVHTEDTTINERKRNI